MITFKSRYLRFFPLAVASLCMCTSALAANNGTDEPTYDVTQQAFTIPCPAETSPTAGSLKIKIVGMQTNPVLYTYSVTASVTSQPISADDFANIAQFFKGEGGDLPVKPTSTTSCSDLLTALGVNSQIVATDFLGLQPSLNAGVYQSVSLAATTAAWQKLKASAEYQNFQDSWHL